MKNDRKKNLWKTILPLALLAAVCVGVVELLACRIYAPGLYDRLTAPVSDAIGAAAGLGNSLLDGLSDLTERPGEAGEEEAPESQLAGEPALSNDLPLFDPVITELTDRDGNEILTGGTADIVYFNQGDETWAEEPYGTDQIGGYGCGPVAMAMAVSSLTEEIVDPAAMAAWSAENGYWASGCGSYLSIVEGAAAAYGLSVQSFHGRTPEDLRLELASGNILVALMGSGHFTRSGHFILLRGATLAGGILVADPNSTERSLTAWDPQLILDELSESTAGGAPLWTLSPAQEEP